MAKTVYDSAALDELANRLERYSQAVRQMRKALADLKIENVSLEHEKAKERGLEAFERWLKEADVQIDTAGIRAKKARAK